MSQVLNFSQHSSFTLTAKNTPTSKTDLALKPEEPTASKERVKILNEAQNIKIRNEIFALFKHQILQGHIHVQNFESLQEIQVVFIHKIRHQNVQQNIRITFGVDYPIYPPKLHVHSCSLTILHPQYKVPSFLLMNQLASPERWTPNSKLADLLASIFQTIEDYHKSEILRLLTPQKSNQSHDDSVHSIEEEPNENKAEQKTSRTRRKSSNMTGCADKELTETKNLNRHFRSKLREVLRDLVANPEEQHADATLIQQIFTPNRVGFEDIRRALSNTWFNQGVRRQMNCGQFLHKILRGMMGIKSKKLMIKYYHVMVSAVQTPSSFIRWKYD